MPRSLRIGMYLVGLLTCACFFSGNTGPVQADTDNDSNPTASRDKQRQIQAETDYYVRRVGTMVRLLQYYRLDEREEKKTLHHVATVLRGLSKKQMNEVIARLDTAAKLKDTKKSAKELEQAYQRHREILKELRKLLSKYDAIRTLEQAADQIELVADKQKSQHLQTAEVIKNHEDYWKLFKSQDRTDRTIARLLGRPLSTELLHQATEQGDLHKSVDDLLKQVDKLKNNLPDDQKARVAKVEKLLQNSKLLENMHAAASKLNKARGYPERRKEEWKDANNLQWKAAGDLKKLARTLRTPTSKLAALKEAKARLDTALQHQKNLKDETKTADTKQKENTDANDKQTDDPKDKLQLPGLTPLLKTKPKRRPKRVDLDDAVKKIQEANQIAKNLSNQQANLEFETRDIRNLLQPHAKDAANELAPAQTAMRQAEAALRKNDPGDAVPPQNKAVKALKQASDKVAKLIAAEEKKKTDPLAALKDTAQKIDKIIKDQKQARALAEKAQTTKQDYQLPLMAGKQKNLAQQTQDLKKEPLITKKDVKPLIDKAANTMKTAAKALEDKKGTKAVDQQGKAIKTLEDVRKELGNKIAEIEKRRDDIAKLTDAAKKLGELAKKEGKIADTAKNMVGKNQPQDANKLAGKQGKLTPQAKDIGKQIAKAAPDAAKKVDSAAKDMKKTQGDLTKNKPSPAAKKAGDATKKLKDAQKSLAKKLDDLKGKDLADQVAMNKQAIDPANAAQQLAKAIEQAKQATAKAQQAAKAQQQPQAQKGQQPNPQAQKNANLAQQQKQVAQDAKKNELPQANKAADKAAKDLEKGNLAKALENQQVALANLKKAAQNPNFAKPQQQPQGPKAAQAKPAAQGQKPQAGQPKPGQPTPQQAKPNQAKPAQAKAGQPAPAQAKPNQAQPANAKPKAGQPKAGQPKAGQPKAGQPKAGQPKAGQPKAGQPKAGQPKAGQPKSAQAKQGQSKSGQAKAGQGKAGQGKSAQAKAGQPKAGQPGQSKSGKSQTAQAKAGPQATPQKVAKATPQGQPGATPQGQPKAGQPGAKGQGQGKGKGQGKGQGQGKGAGQGKGSGQPTPQATPSPTQLAQKQQAIMNATKAAMQSQTATQAAMAALGQAQATAPTGVMPQLQKAGQQLQQAGQQLAKGAPNAAAQAQQQAVGQMQQALNALNAALAAAGQPTAQPGQTPLAMASAKPGQGQGKGQKPGQGQGQKPGQGQGQGKGQKPGQGQGKSQQPSPGNEQNKGKGIGNRIADGKRSNTPSQLLDIKGEGAFIHLPPRQRALIRQAMNGQLPPEYAAQIMQYYVNIARGRAATMPAVTPQK